MHPELLNNSLFLGYYQKWQRNPDSVVFVSIAGYLLKYELVEEAFKICTDGLKRHPNLATAHILMAKIHMAREDKEAAGEELRIALRIAPHNSSARNLLSQLKGEQSSALTETPPMPASETFEEPIPAEWETVTMAKIFSSQGHMDEARRIFQNILVREPENEEALRGLAAINS